MRTRTEQLAHIQISSAVTIMTAVLDVDLMRLGAAPGLEAVMVAVR